MSTEQLIRQVFLPETKGSCLAHFRGLLNLKQSELANTLGLERSTISKMEIGDIFVSEIVWKHVLVQVFEQFELNKSLSLEDFRELVESFFQ
ncbi:helix-turn-helix domain-containing protein [Cytobacillus spongiae]|jgi:transcriptional regulator with XRE-family HTH domain|uniref:helix-turn-helix domain-containing protein n=1 Tax=Cytobacillus spongiae TaxID=2901381 RepID=UPI001F3C61D3|nr:helix-turn-helix transcriptional regulator [Cytobacillus spongiae]UII57771.1 helix-turn-helix domain-containing protein [Cytobacillus spongiae]